ncbi:hypothetical protein [Pseudogulbenkiania subflava]|uniref:hypothetical protein n=1 Tax=Pseudogulbenkiania subflava TaxID=451637 RepID=UPI000A15B32D|nr:hypothetical protein [Pseudogulbenkiania subflava]
MSELQEAKVVIQRQASIIVALTNQLAASNRAAQSVEEKVAQLKAGYEEHLNGVINKLWAEIEKAQARADRYGVLLAEHRAEAPRVGNEAQPFRDVEPSINQADLGFSNSFLR